MLRRDMKKNDPLMTQCSSVNEGATSAVHEETRVGCDGNGDRNRDELPTSCKQMAHSAT